MSIDDLHGQDRKEQQAHSTASRRKMLLAGTSALAAAGVLSVAQTTPVQAQQPAAASEQRPNIVVIMGDDIGMWNIGAYHRGMMAGRTPNLDKIAAEGMLFTDYYAEASCTAGRANFITGELPIRTGMTTVGQAGAPTGMPAEAVTIATALKAMGYATGQFGKNHLGDKNEFLPTVHGFDEFFGYLYHLDAMEDPAHPAYPQELLNTVGPRNMVHSWATNVGRCHRRSALGQGRQAEDRGRRNALSRSGWKPWTTKSATWRSSSSTRPRPTTSRSSSGSIRPACTSSRICRRQVRSDAQLQERLDHPRSRHGAARRRRRHRDEEAQGHGRRRQHHRRLHHRQRHRGLHLAGRRTDAVRAVQGHGHGRRLPRAGDDPLAGQGAGRQGRERHHLRARLVPDVPGRRRQPEHRRGAEEGQADRRPHLQGAISTATTRWT